jgi:succinate-semialdehyde dehydrogenase/glutarate-semialdehyde dehydrogenase
MLAHGEDLARLMAAEQGKPLAEARAEVGYAASFFAWFAEEARRIYGDVIPGHLPNRRLFVRREPVGVVAAITPWNFPLAMITRKAGPALAAGCTIVVKPSELTPFSALALAVLAEEAGVPAGVFSVVTGEPGPIGDVLVEDPRIAKFSFTGSTPVGKALAARCMATVKRVSLELGGNAPLIVFNDADLEIAVEGAIASKYRKAGQTCVCANRIYVQRGIKAAFVERLASRVAGLQTGDALTGDAPIGPLIDDRARTKAQRHVDDAIMGGGRLLSGGHALEGAGYFYAPTLIDDVAPDALLCREETFAPVLGLVGFDAEGDVIALANDTPTGLAAYIFTRDFSRIHRVAEALEVGMVGINTGLITTEVVPFGGIRESGFGREGSRYGIDDYIHTKLLCAAI